MATSSKPSFDLKLLGPLASLAGIWEGSKGADVAPNDDRNGLENNAYRERMTFDPFGPVNNHEQELYGLRYTTTAWRLGEDAPFHEELGYWLWDSKAKQILRCFLVPRGMALIAGGHAEPNAKSFKLVAELGLPTYGICSNMFLDREFKTTRYEFSLEFIDIQTIRYSQDTVIQIKGQKELFHHTDQNTLRRLD